MSNERAGDLQEIFIQDCKFRNLSPATISDYEKFLTYTKRDLGSLTEISRQSVKELALRKLNEGQSPSSVNHYIKTIKTFYAFLKREGYIDQDTMAGLTPMKVPDRLKPVLEPRQISNLIAAIPDSGFYKVRDKIMILMLWDSAMRLKELLTIRITDLDLRFSTVKITGKGRKDRVVPFGQKTKRELVKYLNMRSDNHSEYLFCTLTGYAVGQRNFRRTLDSYAKKAGFKATPHLIRHSAATFLAKSEMPATHLQTLLGHSSLAITQHYINRVASQEGLQLSHRRLSPGDHI